MMNQINTDAWQFEFFVTTIIAVIIVNSTMAINQVFNHLNGILRQNYSIYLQGGLFGLAGKFPFSYTGAVVQGQGLAGIFVTATNVIILTFGINKVDAAFYNLQCSGISDDNIGSICGYDPIEILPFLCH